MTFTSSAGTSDGASAEDPAESSNRSAKPQRPKRPQRPPRPALSGLARVTWRQPRTALLGTVAALGFCALLLLYYGLTMHHDFTSLGLAGCAPDSVGGTGKCCATKAMDFQGDQNSRSRWASWPEPHCAGSSRPLR